MVEMFMFKVQREITPKVGTPELWFMCSACSLMVFYIGVKFHESYWVDTKIMKR